MNCGMMLMMLPHYVWVFLVLIGTVAVTPLRQLEAASVDARGVPQVRLSSGPEDPVVRQARLRIAAMQEKIASLQQLPPAERFRHSADMGLKLERLTNQVSGTRYENQAVYWLAEWSLNHRPVDEALRLILRLDQLPYEAFKQSNRVLLVQALIKQGQLDQAEVVCQALMEDMPEAAASWQLIQFHRQVGLPSPALHGKNLRGGSSNPLHDRPEPWIYAVFFQPGDAQQLWYLEQQLNEFADPAYHGRLAIVLIAMDGDPLTNARSDSTTTASRPV